jgi:hypothetical protein
MFLCIEKGTRRHLSLPCSNMAHYMVRGPRRAILRYGGCPNGKREGPLTVIIYRSEEVGLVGLLLILRFYSILVFPR